MLGGGRVADVRAGRGVAGAGGLPRHPAAGMSSEQQ